MADINTFLQRFPEFDGEAKNLRLINAKFQEAQRRTPACPWNDLQDDGIYYLTAHLLATSPMGQNTKLVAKDGSTTYGKQRERLERIVGWGGRVA